MGVIFFRTKIYKYNRNDEKVYLKEYKNSSYGIMELKNENLFLFDYYDQVVMKRKKKTHYGLAEYIHEDEPLYKLVNVIDYSMNGTYLLFRCEGPIKEEDEESIQLLKEYIQGQISDGAWENGIYLLATYIGDKVDHYLVEDEIEEVVQHPYERDEHMREIYIPGNYSTADAIIDEHIAARKKEIKE